MAIFVWWSERAIELFQLPKWVKFHTKGGAKGPFMPKILKQNLTSCWMPSTFAPY